MYTLPLMTSPAAAGVVVESKSAAAIVEFRVDLSPLTALEAAIKQGITVYDTLANRSTELGEEFYNETDDPARIAVIRAELVQLRDQAQAFDAYVDTMREQLSEAHDAAHDTLSNAYDAAQKQIFAAHEAVDDRIKDIEGFEYLAPAEMVESINADVLEIDKWLANHEGGGVTQ